MKKLSGELEIDEALFGGHRKGKRGWGLEGKSLVFGIYQKNGKVPHLKEDVNSNSTISTIAVIPQKRLIQL